MSIRTIPLEKIHYDERLQARVKTCEATVLKYMDRLDRLPPIKAIEDDEENIWPYDGWHTYFALKKAGRYSFQFTITKGSYRDAVLLACGTNDCHGLPLTNEDKHKIVKTLLDDDEWEQRSNNWIAEHCNVSDYLVKKIRESTNPQDDDSQEDTNSTSKSGSSTSEQSNTNGKPKRRGKDGKSRPSTKKENSDTFVLCDRCSRAGKPSCDECRKQANEGKKPTCKEEEKKSVVLDAEGHPVPDICLASFQANFSEFDSLARSMQKLIDDLSKAPGGEQLVRCLKPTGEEGKTINKSEHLNALKRDMKGTRPHSVCPYCVGKGAKGCKGCNGTAWVTKLTWDNTEDSIKAKLKCSN